jgi:prepilin-type N-terminal cleavage/methylation domain-containing protein
LNKFVKNKSGFTLVELLVVIAIIGILSSVVLASVRSARNKAYYNRALWEFRNINTALMLYLDDYGTYPPDATRDVAPTGFDVYLTGAGTWPKAPWGPLSYYDWDSWDDPDHSGQKIYQISVRFCKDGVCKFPNESWASGFDENSALYYCVSGACRSHVNEPITHPGKCANC